MLKLSIFGIKERVERVQLSLLSDSLSPLDTDAANLIVNESLFFNERQVAQSGIMTFFNDHNVRISRFHPTNCCASREE